MQRYKIINFACVLLLIVAFGACKKVIKINLNSTTPRFVVQGNVVNKPGPDTVSITKTINFDQDNVWPPVSGAIVVITDATANVVDSLKETTIPGNYITSKLTGVPGHTYKLYINAAGNVFTASCTMPAVVTLDSLYTQKSPFGGSKLDLVPVYTDPVATGNYYHFMEYYNDTEATNIFIRNDRLINGKVVEEAIDGGFMKGDSVALYLECVDSAMYQYYYTLNQTNNQNSATPANPQSNITGGALGYFSAHTSSFRSIIVQ